MAVDQALKSNKKRWEVCIMNRNTRPIIMKKYFYLTIKDIERVLKEHSVKNILHQLDKVKDVTKKEISISTSPFSLKYAKSFVKEHSRRRTR